MVMKKTALTVVFFKKIEKFAARFFASVNSQTTKSFDCIVFNDGVPLLKRHYKQFGFPVIEIRCSGSPGFIRERVLSYVKSKGYVNLIFCDGDDFIAENRVEVCQSYLKKYSLVVNDLTLVSESERIVSDGYLSGRFLNAQVLGYPDMLDKNIFGFTNTAIRVSCLKKNMTFSKSLIAIDWNLFARLLLSGAKAVFTNETTTFYRVHKDNMAGLGRDDERSILKALAVKLAQYKDLSGIDQRSCDSYNAFCLLRRNLSESAQVKRAYLKKMRIRAAKRSLWWETARLDREFAH